MGVTVIGVDSGPLVDGAEKTLAAANLVAGTRWDLDAYAPPDARTVELGSLETALNALSSLSGDENGVLLADGDPGFFGVVRRLRERGIRCSTLPATGAAQQLVARLGRSWDDVAVLSPRDGDLARVVNVCRARSATLVLAVPGVGPSQIAAGLRGWRRTLVVAEDLGGPGEEITTLSPAEAANRPWRESSVVLCVTDLDEVPPRQWMAGGEVLPEDGWALPADSFARRDGLLTSSEVRAVALSKLAPRPGTLVWDVGAGCGSVAVECARLGAAAVAVESDEAQVVRMITNATSHGVDVRIEEGQAPAALRNLPKPDSVFVGGGGSDVITSCAHSGAHRVVVALSALERVGAARDTLRHAGYAVEAVQISASRLVESADEGSRLQAADPVVLVSGVLHSGVRGQSS